MPASARATRPALTLSVLVACLLWGIAALAGPDRDPDPWDALVARAEETITRAQASPAALERLRAELAEARDGFLAEATRRSLNARSLQAELDALGPAPAEGTTEPPAIAEERTRLRDAVAAAETPSLRARQSYRRAEVLVNEVDKLIRADMRNRLATRGPPPFSPSGWIAAARETAAYVQRAGNEILTGLRSPTKHAIATQTLPVLLAALGIAAVILMAQPLLLRRIERRPVERAGPARRAARAFATLAIRLILPNLAWILILAGLAGMQPLAPYASRSFNAALAVAPFGLIGAYWIGHVIFAPTDSYRRIVLMPDGHARRALRVTIWLGAVIAADRLLEAIESDVELSTGATASLAALVVAAGAAGLWRLAQILDVSGREQKAGEPPGGSDAAEPMPLARRAVIQLVRLAAIAALVSAAIGYYQIARQALVPTILSLWLLAITVGVQRLIAFALRAAFGRGATTDQGLATLLPLVTGTLLALVTLPLHAQFWGARSSDIGEIWRMMRDGVEIGGVTLSLGAVLVLLITFTIGVVITRWLQKFLRLEVLPKTRLDAGGRNAIVTGFGYVGITLSALIAISLAGLNLSSLAIVAGALSVGIGFGLQAVVSNFVSGIILLIERPVKEGDWIEVAGHSGVVRKISVRSTRVETFDRHDVIVPNAELIAGSVKNMTLSSRSGRLILPVGIAYGSDVEKARDILLDCARGNGSILQHPAPVVLFTGLGDSALLFELRVFVRDIYDMLTVKSDLLFAIYARLTAAGIEIPFPQRSVTLTNPEAIGRAIGGGGAERAGTGRGDVPEFQIAESEDSGDAEGSAQA